MKDKLIEVIRSVPITDKTYPEYVEAVAERLIEADLCRASEVAEEIFAAFRNEMRSFIEASEDLYNKSEDDYYEGKKDAFFTAILHLGELIKNKYTENKGE